MSSVTAPSAPSQESGPAALLAENQRIKQQMSELNASWKQLQTDQATSPPTFYLSVLILFLLVVVPFLTFLYSGILNHQVMLLINQNGVLDAMVMAFKTGNFAVDIDGQEQTFKYFWEEVLVSVMRVITRGRFFLVVALFVVLLGTTLLTYSLYYRGQNYQAAARMISIVLSVILGFTFLFTNNRTMVGPFENVVGYGFVKLFMNKALQDAMNGIFQHKFFTNKYVFPGANIYYDFLLNVMSLETFPSVLEEIYQNNAKYDFEIRTDDEEGINTARVRNLLQIILNKNTVGNMCWLYFASLVGTLISFQYILSNEM